MRTPFPLFLTHCHSRFRRCSFIPSVPSFPGKLAARALSIFSDHSKMGSSSFCCVWLAIFPSSSGKSPSFFLLPPLGGSRLVHFFWELVSRLDQPLRSTARRRCVRLDFYMLYFFSIFPAPRPTQTRLGADESSSNPPFDFLPPPCSA